MKSVFSFLIYIYLCSVFVSIFCDKVVANNTEIDQVSYRKLFGDEAREACKSRDAAQILFSKFKKNYKWSRRTFHNPSSSAASSDFQEIENAYKVIISKYQGTEIGAKTVIQLGGLYIYTRDYDRAIAVVEEASKQYIGTPVENDFYFSLGLMNLQGKKDIGIASDWFKLIPKPSDVDSIDQRSYNDTEMKYLAAQQAIAKCELQQNKFEYAKRRYERLMDRYPFYKAQIARMLKIESDIALTKTFGDDISKVVEGISSPDSVFDKSSANVNLLININQPVKKGLEPYQMSGEDLLEKNQIKSGSEGGIDESGYYPAMNNILKIFLILIVVCFLKISVKKVK